MRGRRSAVNDAALTKLLCEITGEIPGFWWSETAAPPDGEAKVFYGSLDHDPDRAVGWRIYDTADWPYLKGRRAQLRSRGAVDDRAGADELADAVVTRLAAISRDRGISHISDHTFTPLGADESGRQERADNFTITLDNEEA